MNMIFINILWILGTMIVMLITSLIVAGIVMIIVGVTMNLLSWIREKIKDRRMKK